MTTPEAAENPSQPLLQVQDLTVRIAVNPASGAASGEIHPFVYPLKDVSFQIQPGEIVGLLGESGAGKSTLAKALLRLLPPSTQVVQGSIEFEGRPLLALSERELREVRGARISMIYQDSAVLNPVLRVGEQIAEVLRAHHKWPRSPKAMSLLEQMELPDANRVYAAYPHQLSGGQRQRIVIAQALACEPALVVADEPTASLDPITASQIVELLGRLQQRLHTAFLFISHDLVPLTRLADRIIVMYAGRIVEQGTRADVFERPLHPYTRALLACALERETLSDTVEERMEGRMKFRPTGMRLIPAIPGRAPDLMNDIAGCDFESRCPDRMEICRTRFPGETHPEATRSVRCFKYGG